MLQHTPHPAPWVKMRLVSKVQVGHEVVDLDDSVHMCEAIGADPALNGIGIPAESMLPDSWMICSSSSVVPLQYSQKHCEYISDSSSASCPLEHSPAAQLQWAGVLEQLRSTVNTAVRAVVHSRSRLPEELRCRSLSAKCANVLSNANYGGSFGEIISCPEWCSNFARNIADSLDNSGQVLVIRSYASCSFYHPSAGVSELPASCVHGVR
jgi:hypothetical protein